MSENTQKVHFKYTRHWYRRQSNFWPLLSINRLTKAKNAK